MRPPPAPLRFLALAIGGWICLRAAILAPAWWPRIEPAAVAAPPAPALAGAFTPEPEARAPPFAAPHRAAPVLPAAFAFPARRTPDPPSWRMPAAPPARQSGEARLAFAPTVAPVPGPTPRRWSVSAWLLLRDDPGAPALAQGGTLGGSQTGARFLYRLERGLALSARLYAPLRQASGAEAAVGIDWQPSRRPVHLLAERRQRLGGGGRSAFALSLYGGFVRDPPRGPRIDAYGQAGIVGLRARDLFADGSARVSIAVGPVRIGGGAWGAAQPGLARLDAGPSASYRLPVRGANLRIEADWRFRIAGDAAPHSGPALILALDF